MKKITDSDFENLALGVGFCRQIFVFNILALSWHFFILKAILGRKRRLERIYVNAQKRITRYLIVGSQQA